MEQFKLDAFTSAVCGTFCGLRTKSCKNSNCAMKNINKVRHKRMIDIFDFHPSEKAKEIMREIELQERYIRLKED